MKTEKGKRTLHYCFLSLWKHPGGKPENSINSILISAEMLLIIKLPQGEVPFKEVLPEAPYVLLFSESFVCDVSLWLHVPYSYPHFLFLCRYYLKLSLANCWHAHTIYTVFTCLCVQKLNQVCWFLCNKVTNQWMLQGAACSFRPPRSKTITQKLY